MGGRSKHDYPGLTPHKDDHGKIGRETRRWHEIWSVAIRGTNSYYSSTMTDNETFTDPLNFFKCFFLDPNGATRTFNPSGSFDGGFIAFVKNVGTGYSIIFDAESSAQMIQPGQLGIFLYDGTNWR